MHGATKDGPLPHRGIAAAHIDRARGEDFAALEEPELLAEDLRTFFQPLRP